MLNFEITMNTPDERAEAVVKFLLKMARENRPEHFKAFFVGGVLANTVGSLPDDYWREMMKSEICGEPGCDCHVVGEKAMEALDAIRDDWKANAPAGVE